MNENKDVLYLCDQRACGVCRPPCKHTKDIAQAVNFKNKFGAFIEQGATKKTDLMPHAEWLIRDELELGVDKLIQCSNCGYVYHMDWRPPYHYPTFCNVCGRNMIVGVKDK